VSYVSSSISILKRLRSINKNIEDAEFNNLLADLNTELARTNLEVADLMQQLAKLKEENISLKQQSSQKKKVTYFDKLVFENDDISGIPKGSAYCGSCCRNDGRLYSFKQNTKNNFFSCVNCEAEVHYADANLRMTPDIYADLKDKHPHHFS
jgi:hypothetical protein